MRIRAVLLTSMLFLGGGDSSLAQPHHTPPQILYGIPNEDVSVGVHHYAIAFNMNEGRSDSAADRAVVAPTSFTLTDLSCATQGDGANDLGPSGTTAEFTVMRNGAPTSLSATVVGTSGTDRNCAPFPSSVIASFLEGDQLSMRIVVTGAPAPNLRYKWSVKLLPENVGERVLMTSFSPASTQPRYVSVASGSSTETTLVNEMTVRAIWPLSGALVKAVCASSVPFGAGNDRHLDLYLNGDTLVGEPLRCTLDESNATSFGSASGSVAIADGDGLSVRDTTTGDAPTGARVLLSYVFVPDDPALWPILATAAVSISDLRFVGAGHGHVTSALYNATVFQHHPGVVFKRIRVAVLDSPGAGNGWTAALRYHLTQQASPIFELLSCQILSSDTSCSASGDFASVAERWYDVRFVPQGAPAATGGLRWAIAATTVEGSGDGVPLAPILLPD